MCATTYTELLAPTASSAHRAMQWQPAAEGCGVLTVTDSRSHTRYCVVEFAIGRGFAGRAFKLTKQDREEYTVRIGPGSDVCCTCKGFTFAGGRRTCKHIDCCRELILNDWLKAPADDTGDEVETVEDIRETAAEKDAYFTANPIQEDDDMTAEKIETMLAEVNRPAVQPPSMTLRDQFAMSALQGILASHSGDVSLPTSQEAARWAYEVADALLAVRTVTSIR